MRSETEYGVLCCVLSSAFIICIYRLLPPYVALTISTISRGGAKINASCYMTEVDFWLLPPLLKMAPARPWNLHSFSNNMPIQLLKWEEKKKQTKRKVKGVVYFESGLYCKSIPVQVRYLIRPSCWAETTAHPVWWIRHSWRRTCETQLSVSNKTTLVS